MLPYDDRSIDLVIDYPMTIAKARKLLGYEPRVGLEEGFRRTIAWHLRKGLLR